MLKGEHNVVFCHNYRQIFQQLSVTYISTIYQWQAFSGRIIPV